MALHFSNEEIALGKGTWPLTSVAASLLLTDMQDGVEKKAMWLIFFM